MKSVSRSSLVFISILSLLLSAPAFCLADDARPSAVTDQQPQAQTAPVSQPAVEFNKDYVKGYISDLGSILTSPARWDAWDWTTAALVSGATVGLYENDVKIQKWVLDHKTTTTSNIGDKVTYVGFGFATPVVLGGMYLYGHLTDDSKMKSTVLLSAESFVLTGVFVQTLKYSFHRHRPYAGDGSRAWDGPSLKSSSDTASFPSGHASSAFSVATVIATEYDNLPVQVLSYTIASITALNRVAHNAHWSSDIFVGSAIGYFTGKEVVVSHTGGGNTRLSFAPMMIGDDYGAGVTYRF